MSTLAAELVARLNRAAAFQDTIRASVEEGLRRDWDDAESILARHTAAAECTATTYGYTPEEAEANVEWTAGFVREVIRQTPPSWTTTGD